MTAYAVALLVKLALLEWEHTADMADMLDFYAIKAPTEEDRAALWTLAERARAVREMMP